MEEMKLEVIGREVIKPSSPAPKNHLELSLVDFSVPAAYVQTIYFYKGLSCESSSWEMISGRLKSSLSKTLSSFYPLAGRIQGVTVSCNDEGALFTEARTDLLLSDFLKNNLSTSCSLGELLPLEDSAGTWPLLSVKLTFFGSNSGFAVAMSISHKIADAASVLTFAQGWANTAKGEPVAAPPPVFAGATIYPPPNISISMQPPSLNVEPSGKFVINRFIFKSCKISELKRKAVSQSVPDPSRVEAITSFLCRCARKASSSRKSTVVMRHSVDLRLRIPSNVLPSFAIGNLLSTLFYLKNDAEGEMEIGEIVAGFRKAKDGISEIIKESLQGDDTSALGVNLLNAIGTIWAELKSDVDIYAMSSWCRKPFYEVDFGWGTPVWVGFMGPTVHANKMSVMLMDSKDGQDVEAWVVLSKQDMAVFIHDQDLLTYAVLNPPVLI